MALASTFSNIKIINNTVGINILSGGTYTYDSAMTLGGSAIVSGNTFSGCMGNGNPSTNLISVTAGSSNINGNNFIRGVGSSIASYIAVTSTSDQVITNNIFDQTTTNGSNDTLVTNLPIGSYYAHNKNQIVYVTIPLMELANRKYDGTSTFSLDAQNTATNFKVDDLYGLGHYLIITVIGDSNRYGYSTKINLSKYVPLGAKLLSAKTGIKSAGTGVYAGGGGSGGGSEYDGDINDPYTSGYFISARVFDTKTNFTTNTSSIFDPLIENGRVIAETANQGFTIGSAGNLTTLRAAPQYITLDLSDPAYINALDREVVLRWHFYSNLSSGTENFRLAPITIQYRW